MAAFDRHRVGKHEYTYAEGLKLEPPREDGRRCMTVDEMQATGMELNGRGRWHIAEATERSRAHFAKAA